ncbi:phosphotransferase system PTS sorbose-specific IIC subunit [Clostridium sp. DL-VIII]|uniref:PTS mannose/fructose/sorbose/N-acetylgalactosamine transporter subunit IIC n=1 Tax=Clostridium sp. DL-VIII TaxID=641107 RepID=UPI00023B0170|nr:PTS sugar transporter subunit IIC [Clostridium sp. DL-VIII]EHI99230.1 phosphotransferase system PTS sorbose-specific IIC subunit [Clostridium sp. DL-VIII]
MLIQAILLAIWAGICFLDERTTWTGIHKPLIAGAITGLILGDVRQGLIIGGTLEIMWLGTASVGAYIPPNVTAGSIIGTAIGIISGGGIASGIAIAIPTSIVCQQILMLAQTISIAIIHRADKVAETGDFDKVARLHYLAAPLYFLAGFVPVFITIFIGGQAAQQIINYIPKSIMNGLTVASGIIPAVGMGMLLMMMMKRDLWIFLVLGFALAAYLKLPILSLALIGIPFAFIYNMLKNNRDYSNTVANNTIVEDGNGGFDL